MNPRHSMQGRRFLFKEIGGARVHLYGVSINLFLVWVITYYVCISAASSDQYVQKPKPFGVPLTEKGYAKYANDYQERARQNRRDYPFQIFCTEEQRQRMTALLIEIQETGGRF